MWKNCLTIFFVLWIYYCMKLAILSCSVSEQTGKKPSPVSFFVLNRGYLKLKIVCFNNCMSINGRSYILMLYPLFRLSKRLILLSIHAFNKPAVSIDKISCMVLKQVQFPQMKMFQNTQTSEFCYIWFYAAHTVIRCSF